MPFSSVQFSHSAGEPEDIVIVVGNNTINVTEAMHTEGGFESTITIETEGNYKFLGDFLVRIYNAMGMNLGTGTAYLTPGTYNLQIVTAYLPSAGTYGLNVELEVSEEPDPGQPSGNPVIESLPFTYEVSADGLDMDGVYYDYTATEQVTLIITKPAGGRVSLTAQNPWEEDDNGNYVQVVNAGETITLNFWSSDGITEGVFTVSVQDDEPAGPSTPVPPHENKVVTLATRNDGGPYITDTSMKFGQKYNVGENILKGISISDMATYSDGGVNTWSFKVWKWNSDYATTTAAEPLFVQNGENHKDNHTFTAIIPADLYITGEFYYEIEYLSGSARFTSWCADAVVEGLESYTNGVKTDKNNASSLIVGVPLVEDPNFYPTVVIDLSKFADQLGYKPSFPEAGISARVFSNTTVQKHKFFSAYLSLWSISHIHT